MAAHARMFGRLFDRQNRVTHFKKILQCLNGNNQRLCSGATHKKNKLELGNATLSAPNFNASLKTRPKEVILERTYYLTVQSGRDYHCKHVNYWSY